MLPRSAPWICEVFCRLLDNTPQPGRHKGVVAGVQDLRSDRQPEFTQLDLEMAFMDQEAVLALTERLMATVFREVPPPPAPPRPPWHPPPLFPPSSLDNIRV